MYKNGLIFLLPGLFVLGFGIQQIYRSISSSSWPTVQGEITDSGVGVTRSGKSNSSNYEARVRYRYTVDGNEYENDTVRIGQISTFSQTRAQKISEQHPKGMTTIYYNPTALSDSVLEPGFHFDNVLAPLVGLVFASVGLFMFINHRRKS